MKCVHSCGSVSGSPKASRPSAMLFIRKDMLRASVRIVCKPSASCAACPGSRPWMLFQYWLEATGIPEIVKNLFSSSKVAEQPPRRAQTTDAPTFMALSNDVL